MLDYFPKFFTSRAISIYLVALLGISLIFFRHVLPVMWWFFGLAEVIAFFYFSNKLTLKWSDYSDSYFSKMLIQSSLIIRVAWVLFSYAFYSSLVGTPFDFSAADALGYHGEAQWVARMIREGNLAPYFSYINGRYSDMGYPFYLGILYWITGDSIIIARLLKALFSTLTVLYVYRLASRNFGEETGRMAGIFTMLFPNLIFYTGFHLKEVEMVFLVMLFLERADALIRLKRVSILKVFVLILIGGCLFFFRTVLGAAALFALFTALIFSNREVSKSGQRWFVSLWIVLAITFFMGGNIASEVEEIWESRNQNQQESMEWRSEREGGNAFAKYASATVFAPAIFLLPFPTMVNIDSQPNQMMMNGGYYVKNIMAFFVLMAFYFLISGKKWRDNILLTTFILGYLIIIAFSSFAQSERFHQPALPVFLILAAYGVNNITEKHKKLFNIYLGLIFIILIAWSWFKLAGRNMV